MEGFGEASARYVELILELSFVLAARNHAWELVFLFQLNQPKRGHHVVANCIAVEKVINNVIRLRLLSRSKI